MGPITYRIVGDKVIAIHKVIVAKIVSALDYAPDPRLEILIQQWQDSPEGIFIGKNAIKTEMYCENDVQMYSMRHWIVAEIEEKKLLEYYLKFDKPTFL